MQKIVKADEPFERIEESRDKALQICRDLQQPYKVEHIEEGLAEHGAMSFYRQGEFLDLCRGPHVPTAGAIGAFKLLSLAGAYWKGDASPPQLQRLYGTAFFSKQELEEHLKLVEEAKKRDHRVLGKRLDLFTISPAGRFGPDSVAAQGRHRARAAGELSSRRNCSAAAICRCTRPISAGSSCTRPPGHYPYYKESMFTPIVMEDGEQFLLKPMNCPHHIMIYKSKPRSYRELPLRLAEFGTVYRYEQSGELSGMTRVRGFTQDDAHIFCTHEQVADEFRGCMEMTQFVLDCLGLNELPRAARVPRSDERQVRG